MPQPSNSNTQQLDSARAKQTEARRKMQDLLDRRPCRQRTDELRHVVGHHHD